MIAEANASVNPAVEALEGLMLGVTRHTKPVIPTTAADRKLEWERTVADDSLRTSVNQQIFKRIDVEKVGTVTTKSIKVNIPAVSLLAMSNKVTTG